MGVDQPKCGADRAAKWSNTRTLAKKSSQTFDRWAVGCNLVVLKKMACSQSHCKIQAPFSATPYEQFKVLSLSLVLYLVQRCDACHFILNEAVQNSALALH
jgi:hypothetical protein